MDRRVFDLTVKFKESDQTPAISQTRSVEHIHYKSWVDMSVPDADQASSDLLEIAEKDAADFLINQYKKLTNQEDDFKKIVVHCKAGVGRTGTLLAIINSIITLKYFVELSIFSIVRRLREQRFEMCETK